MLTTAYPGGRMIWRRWGSGPPVVLLHGGYGSWTHWVRNVTALAVDRQVLAPDLPGLGDSDPPPAPADGGTIVDIVVDGLEALLPPDAKAHLVGFSFGGIMGGPVAARLGRRVASLVLVGAGGHGPDRRPVELESWRREEAPEARVAIHRENLRRLMFADPGRIDDLAVRLQVANAERARLQSRPISRTPILADSLADVAAPVAAIFGEQDATSWPDVADRLARLSAIRPDLVARTIPGAGHWAQYEAATAFNAVLLDLLASFDATS